ncbi:la-related protein 7 [Leptopilina heterotoma]|uniref:la-related protein 7 n=1 Tax=Leptopilina heterotoma TaxID=63436 RepID=UPI001CA7C34F|nr:la-related protein 7 [Leptopilina heterotoma]
MVSEEQESEMELASETIPVPPVENVIEEPVVVEEQKPEIFRKKPRKRHRELHASILKQMEFYFGDANLSKDRFLGRLISQDPWIDLDIFIKFNKVAALTTDVSRIAKALRDSTMLSVSEDGTKVCRTTPICKKENSDECTIYVQKLPSEADHDWISKIFSQYGQIDYISIPKYKNKAIKGFAFVEFKTPKDVFKCITAFKEKGGLLPSETTPNTLLSITTHENCDDEIAKQIITKKENKTEETENKEEKIDNSQKKKRLSTEDTSTNDEDENSKIKKKKYANNESDQSDSTGKESKKVKKRKTKSTDSINPSDVNDESIVTECDKKQKKEKKLKRKAPELESKVSDQETENQSDTEIVPKKVKKSDENNEADKKSEETNKDAKSIKVVDKEIIEKKKKRKRKRSKRRDEIEAPDTGLEIMAKKEWKRLRNKYLDMQKAKMQQLKQHLKRAMWNQWQNVERNKTEKEEMNKKTTEKKDAPRFSFSPGLIVQIEMESPCSDPQNFKMEIKGSSSSSSIKYVDIREGSNIAFVRFDSSESAKSFTQKTRDDRTMTILEGDEEKSYWDKMTSDRKDKIENNIRVKQRGRDKLLKKAEKELGKHIKFDEV